MASAAGSSVDSAETESITAAAAAAPPGEKTEGQQSGGGVVDAVLLLVVRFVLAGVQGVAVLEWLLGRVSEALVWMVELGILLVQPPN